MGGGGPACPGGRDPGRSRGSGPVIYGLPVSGAALPPIPILLAFPRARAGLDPLLLALLPHLEAVGLGVRHLALDAAATDAELQARLAAAVATEGVAFLGGFSLGARIAVRYAAGLTGSGPSGLVCFGYPFVRPGHPRPTDGLDVLRTLRTPTLIVQGTRDPHGDRTQVPTFGPLPSCARLRWLQDGNHRLAPRVRSGHTLAEHLASAAGATAAFVASTLEGADVH